MVSAFNSRRARPPAPSVFPEYPLAHCPFCFRSMAWFDIATRTCFVGDDGYPILGRQGRGWRCHCWWLAPMMVCHCAKKPLRLRAATGMSCQHKPLIWLDGHTPCRVPNSGNGGREHVYSLLVVSAKAGDLCAAGNVGPRLCRGNSTDFGHLFSIAARTRATVSAGVRETCPTKAATCSPVSGSTSTLSLSASAR
jgi:hypothetical protein